MTDHEINTLAAPGADQYLLPMEERWDYSKGVTLRPCRFTTQRGLPCRNHATHRVGDAYLCWVHITTAVRS